MKAQWKRITAMLADFKPEDRVTVPVGPLLWANEEIERLRADAERYKFLEHDFSPMGLDANGNHAWAYRRNATLRGPSLSEAIDNATKEQS